MLTCSTSANFSECKASLIARYFLSADDLTSSGVRASFHKLPKSRSLDFATMLINRRAKWLMFGWKSVVSAIILPRCLKQCFPVKNMYKIKS